MNAGIVVHGSSYAFGSVTCLVVDLCKFRLSIEIEAFLINH